MKTDELSAFEILGLPLDPRVQRKVLQQHMRERLAYWHPDRYQNALESERVYAETQAARINQAYQKLCDPMDCLAHALICAFFHHDESILQSSPAPATLMLWMEREEEGLESPHPAAWQAQLREDIDKAWASAYEAFDKKEPQQVLQHWQFLRWAHRLLERHLGEKQS